MNPYAVLADILQELLDNFLDESITNIDFAGTYFSYDARWELAKNAVRRTSVQRGIHLDVFDPLLPKADDAKLELLRLRRGESKGAPFMMTTPIIDRLRELAQTYGPPTGANAGEGADDGKKPLPPSRLKAYRLYQWAIEQNPELAGKTDREVYDWLKTKPDQASDLPANTDTFSTYLKEARRHHGTQKHTTRSRRAKGKSVVNQDQL